MALRIPIGLHWKHFPDRGTVQTSGARADPAVSFLPVFRAYPCVSFCSSAEQRTQASASERDLNTPRFHPVSLANTCHIRAMPKMKSEGATTAIAKWGING